MNRRLFLYVAILFSFAMIAGCQSNELNDQGGTSTQEVSPVPYSRGPTTPPYVKGPPGPPPSTPKPAAVDSGDSQAVSEVETVRYSLPENADVKVKQ
jgi:hypothetical protein